MYFEELVAGSLFVLMSLATLVKMIGRYFFNSPIGWAEEFSRYAFIWIVFLGAAGTIGPIIPPSIPFVIYGSLANTSIGRLLLAGAMPGVLMGILLMVFVHFIARRRGYPAENKAFRGELLQATPHAIPPMGMPVIIWGDIIAGDRTPTEAACAGAAYAFVLGFFVYGEPKLRDLPKIITESVAGTAAVAIIIAVAQPMGWILTYEETPMKVLALFQDAQLSKAALLQIG